jgi:hypothetical protein
LGQVSSIIPEAQPTFCQHPNEAPPSFLLDSWKLIFERKHRIFSFFLIRKNGPEVFEIALILTEF